MLYDILLSLPITKIKRLVNFWIRTSLQPVCSTYRSFVDCGRLDNGKVIIIIIISWQGC